MKQKATNEIPVPYVGDYCPALLEENDWSDIKVEFVNKPFDTSKAIMST